DRDPALIPAILESLEDGHEIGVAEAGAAAVAVVGMEMARARGMTTYQLRGRGRIRAHGLDIEVKEKDWVIDAIEDFQSLAAGVDELSLRWRQRFQAQKDAGLGNSRHGPLERIDSVVGGLSPGGLRWNAPLAWRSENHQLSAQVPTATGKFDQVIRS